MAVALSQLTAVDQDEAVRDWIYPAVQGLLLRLNMPAESSRLLFKLVWSWDEMWGLQKLAGRFLASTTRNGPNLSTAEVKHP